MPVLEHGFRSLLTARIPNVIPGAVLRAARNLAVLAAAGSLLACAGSQPPPGAPKLSVPEDMPDICQDLDFNRDVEYRDLCGVKTRDYRAYRNIPEHRNLLQPKGGKLVKKGKALELRLPNTLPAALPPETLGKIVFDEKLRRAFIKSRMDYWEYFPDNSTHNVKIIKIDIPLDTGGELTLCYTVESGPATAQRKAGYASRLESLACADFTSIKTRALATQQAEQAPSTAETSQPESPAGPSVVE